MERVGVEPLRAFTARSGPVQGVQVEPRRPALEQLGRADVLTELDVRPVGGQVVIDELTQIGEAGWDVGVRLALLDHRGGDLASVGVAELTTLRADPREPERRRRTGRQCRRRSRSLVHPVRLAAGPATQTRVDEPLTFDEAALGAVLHSFDLPGPWSVADTSLHSSHFD